MPLLTLVAVIFLVFLSISYYILCGNLLLSLGTLHVPTEDQRADILTKTVSGVVFQSHVDYLLSTQF